MCFTLLKRARSQMAKRDTYLVARGTRSDIVIQPHWECQKESEQLSKEGTI